MAPIDARRSRDHGDGGGALVLSLVIAETDPLSGTVGLPGQASATEFHGWIDLMSAVSDLASSRSDDPDGAS